jgi:hypothetical protein
MLQHAREAMRQPETMRASLIPEYQAPEAQSAILWARELQICSEILPDHSNVAQICTQLPHSTQKIGSGGPLVRFP